MYTWCFPEEAQRAKINQKGMCTISMYMGTFNYRSKPVTSHKSAIRFLVLSTSNHVHLRIPINMSIRRLLIYSQMQSVPGEDVCS